MTVRTASPGPLDRLYTDPDAVVALTLLARLTAPALARLAVSSYSTAPGELQQLLSDSARLAGELASPHPPAPGFAFEGLLRAAASRAHDRFPSSHDTGIPRSVPLPDLEHQPVPVPPHAAAHERHVVEVLGAMVNVAYRISLLELYEHELGTPPALRYANLATALHALAVKLESASLLDPLDPFGFLLARRPLDALTWSWVLTVHRTANRLRP